MSVKIYLWFDSSTKYFDVQEDVPLDMLDACNHIMMPQSRGRKQNEWPVPNARAPDKIRHHKSGVTARKCNAPVNRNHCLRGKACDIDNYFQDTGLWSPVP